MKGYTLLRGSIYVLIAMLTAFSGWLNELTPEKVAALTWVQWSMLVSSVVIGGLTTLRAYIDKSAARNTNENEKSDSNSTVPPAA